jgi:hypothetical protein
MTNPQRLLLLTHVALATAFTGYTAALAIQIVEQVQTGYFSEGARVGVVLATLTTICVLFVVGGVAIWTRTGQRRYPVVADSVVVALTSTALLGLIFFDPTIYFVVVGLAAICTLLAAVIRGPEQVKGP